MHHVVIVAFLKIGSGIRGSISVDCGQSIPEEPRDTTQCNRGIYRWKESHVYRFGLLEKPWKLTQKNKTINRRNIQWAMFGYFLPSLLLSYQLAAAAWPSTPFSTSGRWILNSAGENVTYAGVNWPGAADTMIPEGLQYSSIDDIVAKIKSVGLNVIRLTYAIEMIDQIYENDGNDIPLLTAFTEALGTENGTAIYNDVLANNPSFTSETTRLEVNMR
jgi:hypothetical protein